MQSVFLACAAISALSGVLAAAGQNDATAREILVLERKVMDGWQTGNPDPCIALADPEITYFHIVSEKRIDGLPALKSLFDANRGRPLFDSYEMADPQVQVSGDIAVLSYILIRHLGANTSRWNSTQIYQHKKEGWRVIHSHWSATKLP